MHRVSKLLTLSTLPMSQAVKMPPVSPCEPLCAAFRPDSECVCGAAEKAHVAPTCGQCEKTQAQYASPMQKSPAAAGKILPFGMSGMSQHRICLVCGEAAALPNAPGGAAAPHPIFGQKPTPTFSYDWRKT